MSVDEDWLQAQGAEQTLLRFTYFALHDAVPERLGVAVSGGGDSMAMLHLLVRLGGLTGWKVDCVTVNHGLRDAAQSEAEFVAASCAALGVSHTILHWERHETSGNLMDQASRARRRLIADWALARNIGHVALGHTVDDQAETFVMRLARKSGVDGLSAMRTRWCEGGITWVRPLLFCYRTDLREFLLRGGYGWVEDPTNEDMSFDRAKVRAAMPDLAKVGLRNHELAAVAWNLAQARNALNDWAGEVAARIVCIEQGDVVLDNAELIAAHPEVRRRILLGALRWVSSSDYPPRSDKLSKLELSLKSQRSHTLLGCLVLSSDGTSRMIRELDAVRDAVAPSNHIWDKRWQLDGPHDPALQIRALGEIGIRQCPDWRATGLPRQSLLASPAIWRGDTLIAAPLAGKPAGWAARTVTDFHASLLSH